MDFPKLPRAGVEATIVFFFCNFLRVFCGPKIQGVLYNSVKKEFAISDKAAGFIFALMNASSFLLAPFGDILLNFVPFRVSCSVGILLYGSSLSLVYLIESTALLAVCFICIGSGLSIQLTNFIIYLSTVSGDAYPVLASASSLSTSVGIILLPPIVQYLLETFGVRGTYLIMGALVLHGVPAVCCLKVEIDRGEENSQRSISDILPSISKYLHPTTSYVVSLSLALVEFSHQGLYFAFNLYIIPFAESRRLDRDYDVSLLGSISGAGGVLGKLLAIVCFCYFSQRMACIFLVYIGSSLVASVTLAMYLLVDSYGAWLLFTFCNGLVIHLHVSMLNGLIQQMVSTEAFAYAVGAQLFLYGVGEISSGIVSGILYEVCECYELLFIGLSGCSILGALFVAVIFLHHFFQQRTASPVHQRLNPSHET